MGVFRLVSVAVAACGPLVAGALWIYAQSIDTSVTTSDRNLFENGAGVLAATSIGLLFLPILAVLLRRAAREVQQAFGPTDRDADGRELS